VTSTHVDDLKFILQDLAAENEDIQGSTIVSIQGLPIASVFNDRAINESLVSAMSAAILAVAESAAKELKRGTLKRTMIEGEEGNMILTQAGDHALLVTLVSKNAGLGIIFLLIDSVRRKIAKILDG
jgi:uncharacterized protein